MNNKVRSTIQAIAIVVVLLCVVMQLHWVIIPAILQVTGFGPLSSRLA